MSTPRLFSNNQPKQEMTGDFKPHSPTVTYFIEKLRGNANLDVLEKPAMEYAKNHKDGTPCDEYFLMKNGVDQDNGHGTIPKYILEKMLKMAEEKALEYADVLCIKENEPQPVVFSSANP